MSQKTTGISLYYLCLEDSLPFARIMKLDGKTGRKGGSRLLCGGGLEVRETETLEPNV